MNQNLPPCEEFIPTGTYPHRVSNPSFFERSPASPNRSQPHRALPGEERFSFTEKYSDADIFSVNIPQLMEKDFLQNESLPSLFTSQQLDNYSKTVKNFCHFGILKAEKYSTTGLSNQQKSGGNVHQKIFFFNRKLVFIFLNVCTFESHDQSSNEAKVDV